MWYEDENLVEDNWMVSVRLEVPLGKPGSESFTPRRRHLQERLLEPVHRQNAAIQTGISFEPSRVKRSTVLSTSQQVQRFFQDLQGWGAVYTGKSSGSPSSNHVTGATIVVASPSSGSGSTATLGGGSGLTVSGAPASTGSTVQFSTLGSSSSSSNGLVRISGGSLVLSNGPTYVGGTVTSITAAPAIIFSSGTSTLANEITFINTGLLRFNGGTIQLQGGTSPLVITNGAATQP